MQERGPNDAQPQPAPPAGTSKRNRQVGWLVLLAAAVAITVAVLDRTPAGKAAASAADNGTTTTSQAASAPASDTAATAPVQPATPAAAAPSPSVLVSDNPAFDLTGSGDACRMHYFQDDQGRAVTLFDLATDGELITHVSGPDGIGRHDEQMTRGVSRIVYGFPLAQATDMGAVLYLADGTQQSCTISAGADAP